MIIIRWLVVEIRLRTARGLNSSNLKEMKKKKKTP